MRSPVRSAPAGEESSTPRNSHQASKHTMKSRFATTFAAIGLALAVAGPAHGQGAPTAPKGGAAQPAKKPLTEKQKKDEAKKKFEEANKKFESGDFAAAYTLFKEADDLVPGAVPKYRMAESKDKGGEVGEAIKGYEAFLASNPPADKNQARIDAAKARIDSLKKTPAEVKVTVTPANATLMIDGAAASGNPIKVPPGKHTLSAKAEGFADGSTEIDVAFAEKKEVTLTLEPKAAGEVAAGGPTPTPAPTTTTTPPPVVPEEDGGSSPVPAIITLSLAGAGAVVGTIFGVLALGSKSDFEETPTQELFDETERNALIADMSFGVAITFGVTGLVLLITSSGSSDEPAEPAKAATLRPDQASRMNLLPKQNFTPLAGPQGGGASYTVTF